MGGFPQISQGLGAFDFSTRIKDRRGEPRRSSHKAPQCGAFRLLRYRRSERPFFILERWYFKKRPMYQGIPPFWSTVVGKEQDMKEDNREKITLWLQPDILRRVDSWLEEDNCKTRREFVEKALRFYMGYLATEDTSEYLSRALVDTLQGIVADNSNRLRTMIFKWCVELNMMGHTIAAHFRADPINRRELRAYAVDEVKRTNGQISFDRALDQQRRLQDNGL